MEQKIYVDTFGIKIELVCRDYEYNLLNLSTASSLKVLVKKGLGDEVEWEGAVDPVDTSKIIYTTKAGDFDVPGDYLLQGQIIIGTAFYVSETVKITVFPRFE